jgi:hypothetical protein
MLRSALARAGDSHANANPIGYDDANDATQRRELDR